MPEAESPIPLPPHAYVPGVNARHPENWFDAIKSTVTEDVPQHLLHETRAFKAGVLYLRNGYFWESHEVLEAVWLRTSADSLERHMVQALIQLANAQLKLRMGKHRAAWRLCDMVLDHLARCPTGRAILSLDRRSIEAQVQPIREQAKSAL